MNSIQVYSFPQASNFMESYFCWGSQTFTRLLVCFDLLDYLYSGDELGILRRGRTSRALVLCVYFILIFFLFFSCTHDSTYIGYTHIKCIIWTNPHQGQKGPQQKQTNQQNKIGKKHSVLHGVLQFIMAQVWKVFWTSYPSKKGAEAITL